MRNTSNNIVVTGGKTGGHIYPALAIADILAEEYGVKPYYIGAKDGMESKILGKEKIPFFGIDFAPLVGISLGKKIKSIFINILGFFRSIKLLTEIRPRLMIGTGGFVAGPVLSAAFIMGIPVIIHEQNASPGFTNKVLSRISKEIWITFNESSKYFPKNKTKILTGMPLRNNLKKIEPELAKSYFEIAKNQKVLLITGGSQGSKLINDTIRPLYKKIIKELNLTIIHLSGPGFYEQIIDSLDDEEKELAASNRLLIKGYLSEMEMALNAADITISRAGASFICELIATKSYSILIPIKNSANNHQLKNAKSVEKAGMGRILEEEELDSQKLFATLSSLRPFEFDNINSINAGILYGDNTRAIIRKESGKYLNE